MPNWATNDVEVYGNKDTLEKLLADAKEGTFKRYFDWNRDKGEYDSFTEHENLFSFDSLVPTPKFAGNKQREANGEQLANALNGNLDFEYDNPYDWHLAHWGTKWDLDQDSLTLNAISEKDGHHYFTIGFITAWSPACQFWQTISEKYGVYVINNYYEEGMNYIGTYEVSNGVEVNNTCVEISKEMWKKAGATFDKKGEIEWGEGEIILSNNFPIRA